MGIFCFDILQSTLEQLQLAYLYCILCGSPLDLSSTSRKGGSRLRLIRLNHFGIASEDMHGESIDTRGHFVGTCFLALRAAPISFGYNLSGWVCFDSLRACDFVCCILSLCQHLLRDRNFFSIRILFVQSLIIEDFVLG